MSQTVHRQTNQMPAWLVFWGGVIGTVGAIVMRHAENVDQLILALGSPAELWEVAAPVTYSECGLVLLIVGVLVALTGIVVIAARQPM